MMEIGENETEKYEDLLQEYKSVFHQNHFQVDIARSTYLDKNVNMFKGYLLDHPNKEISNRKYQRNLDA